MDRLPAERSRTVTRIRPRAARAAISTFALVLALSLGAPGCGTTGGGGVTLFPAGHQLIPSARILRSQAPWPAPVPRELSKSVLPAYIVQPGDGLLIEPESLDTPLRIPADQTVLADGTIDLGPYGRVVVAGRTIEEIESLIEATVTAQENARADADADAVPEADADEDRIAYNVRLIDPDSAVFYVLGDVNSPGSYPLIGRETVLDGIVAAGGLSDRASRCDIILARPSPPADCRTVLPVCYDKIVQLGDTTTNYQLAPGDRIYVASRPCWHDILPACLKPACLVCGDYCGCPCPDATGWGHPVQYSAPPVIVPANVPEIVPEVPSPAEAALR